MLFRSPRSEEPAAIISQIVAGAEPALARVHIEPDRRAAIRLALSLAKVGDVLLVAGKGHETGQELGDRTIPFDDRQVLREEIPPC